MNKDLIKMGCLLSTMLIATTACGIAHKQEQIPTEEEVIITPSSSEPLLNPEDYAQNEDEIEIDLSVQGTWDIFTITYYCGCDICNGDWGSFDAYGDPLAIGTCACNVLPLGTTVVIGDNRYVVRDRLSSIYDGENRIDIYVESHEEALELGIQYGVEVFIENY